MSGVNETSQKTTLETFPGARTVDLFTKWMNYVDKAVKDGTVATDGSSLFDLIHLFLSLLFSKTTDLSDYDTKVMLFTMMRTIVAAIDETLAEELHDMAGFRREAFEKLLMAFRRIAAEELSSYP